MTCATNADTSWSILGGLINFANPNNFGTGNITLNSGGVQWAPGNTFDISGRLNTLGSDGGIFDTNGNNVGLASIISGAGPLTKAGPLSRSLAQG